MNINRSLLVPLVFLPRFLFAQGSLTPPGPPAPTMKTLDQLDAHVGQAGEQRTVINGTNTPGDSGSQFIISGPGSYYLTGNITGVSGKNGIAVVTDDVTINLNGFKLGGVSGSLRGIIASVPSKNLCVTNGIIRDWGREGISAGTLGNCSFDNLVISNNALDGVQAGYYSKISNCVFANNGGNGLETGDGSVVTLCSSATNSSSGFSLGRGISITGCSSYYNNVYGISCVSGSVVTHCSVHRGNSDGIVVGNDCYVIENTCYSLGNAGIHATGANNRIESNHSDGNATGVLIDSTGNLLIRNTAIGNTTNYDVVAGNKVGPIVTPPDSGAIHGNSGAAGLVTTDPWANFAY